LRSCDEPVAHWTFLFRRKLSTCYESCNENRLAYLFIAHDLAVVEHISHRVMVMYLGKVVETGPAKSVCRRPKHPYTQALLSAVPAVDPASKRQRILLSGELPSPIDPPPGCPFHPRCPIAEPRCRSQVPALRTFEGGQVAACHLAK
jgi:oligopeptide/dipeptide ABC transporter ATP-binding protein